MASSPTSPSDPPVLQEAQVSVDGITTSAPSVPDKRVAGTKWFLVSGAGLGYIAFVIWCLVLLAVLPSPTGQLRSLQGIGVVTSLGGIAVFFLVGVLLLQRIAKADVPVATRQRSLIRLVAILVPGIVLGIVVPFMILREPPLFIDTIPSNQQEFMAPLSLTFSLDRSVQTLLNLGKRPVQYIWDTEGDGKPNDRTVVPRTTAIYERAGAYVSTVRIMMDDGSSKLVSLRVIIRNEVFTVNPDHPIVEKPARFSIAQLVPDPKLLKRVQWDFDGDGTMDGETKTPEILHTYNVTGSFTVKAVVDLQNEAQKTYQRSVSVVEPPPLPFPITLTTEPKQLIGPAPFGVLFTLKTKEQLREVVWLFGDGKEERGEELRRIGHSFDKPGIYAVEIRARSASGSIAELTSLVRATNKLSLSDLRFEGVPAVKGNTVSGDIPLTIQLTPKTGLPLVQFSWEIPPDQNESTVTGDTFQGVFRREGTSTVTLVAVGSDGSSLRLPIKISATKPATEPAFDIRPETGSAPLTVSFDASNAYVPPDEKVAGFRWEFGDGTQGRDVELGGSKVQHTYERAGEYKATMTIVTASGKEYEAQRTIVVRKPSIIACLTASRRTVGVGKGVEFDSSCSTGTPASILWDVRSVDKPNTVVEQSDNPTYVHVFEREGTYTVTLTLKNAEGYSDSKSITITVTP